MLDGLEQTGTAPTLRLAVRFMLLTAVLEFGIADQVQHDMQDQ